jgi:hypothetical protein
MERKLFTSLQGIDAGILNNSLSKQGVPAVAKCFVPPGLRLVLGLSFGADRCRAVSTEPVAKAGFEAQRRSAAPA